MTRILIPRDPGVGSAIGFLDAPVSFEIVRSRYGQLDAMELEGLRLFFDDMLQEACAVVRAGAPDGALVTRRRAFMRYHGQGHEIEIPLPDRALRAEDIPALKRAFEAEYSRQFSRAVPGMTIEILNWAVDVSSEPQGFCPVARPSRERRATPTAQRPILCEITGKWRDADIYDRAALCPGDHLPGPALVAEPQTTTYVSADFSAQIDGGRNIWLIHQREAEA